MAEVWGELGASEGQWAVGRAGESCSLCPRPAPSSPSLRRRSASCLSPHSSGGRGHLSPLRCVATSSANCCFSSSSLGARLHSLLCSSSPKGWWSPSLLPSKASPHRYAGRRSCLTSLAGSDVRGGPTGAAPPRSPGDMVVLTSEARTPVLLG